MTISHHKLLTREGRVLENGWTHPSFMTIEVQVFTRSVIRKATIVILKTIWHKLSSIVYLQQAGWQCKYYITLFKSITMLCGTYNILQNIPHISMKSKQTYRGAIQIIVLATWKTWWKVCGVSDLNVKIRIMIKKTYCRSQLLSIPMASVYVFTF